MFRFTVSYAVPVFATDFGWYWIFLVCQSENLTKRSKYLICDDCGTKIGVTTKELWYEYLIDNDDYYTPSNDKNDSNETYDINDSNNDSKKNKILKKNNPKIKEKI